MEWPPILSIKARVKIEKLDWVATGRTVWVDCWSDSSSLLMRSEILVGLQRCFPKQQRVTITIPRKNIEQCVKQKDAKYGKLFDLVFSPAFGNPEHFPSESPFLLLCSLQTCYPSSSLSRTRSSQQRDESSSKNIHFLRSKIIWNVVRNQDDMLKFCSLEEL